MQLHNTAQAARVRRRFAPQKSAPTGGRAELEPGIETLTPTVHPDLRGACRMCRRELCCVLVLIGAWG